MLKDYKKALKYCKLILQYEPNNSTAKEFYPLILDKLQGAASSDSDENYNKSSSPELQSADPSAGESSDDQQVAAAVATQEVLHMDDGIDEFCVSEDNSSGEPNSHYSNLSSSMSGGNCISPAESLSISADDEKDADPRVNALDEDDMDDEEDDDEEEEEEEDDDDDAEDDEDINSSSGDDLPIDEPHGNDDAGVGNAGHASHSSSGGEGRSRSDNTTHSYSSLLLEEEDDIVPINFLFAKDLSAQDLDVTNGNKIPSTSCSDSESPTEPLTQRLAAILRSTCGVSNIAPESK